MSIQKFDENKFKYDSFYKDDVAVTRFKFGHDVPILETELNEMQIVQENKMLSFFKKVIPSGFLDLVDDNFDGEKIVCCPPDKGDNLLFNHICIAPFNAMVNGNIVKLRGNFSYAGYDDYILIDLGDAPEYNTSSDLVYLEVWFENVKASRNLVKYGYQGGEYSDYSIMDNRINSETSRRVAMFWNIRVAKNVDFNTYPEGLGYKNKFVYSPIKATANGNCIEQNSGDYVFANASHIMFKDCDFYNDNNLWVAGRPNVTPTDSALYGNYVFAMPLFKVDRRNQGKYSINNYNGAISYTHALTSDLIESYKAGDLGNNLRPDGLFYDYIDKRDISDIRKLTNVSPIDSNNMLNKTINDLLNNNLMTKENDRLKRIQISNVTPNYNSNLVNLFIKFNNNITPLFINENDPEYNITYKDGVDKNPVYEKSLNNYGLVLNGDYKTDYTLYNDDANALIGTLEFFMQPYWFGNDDTVNQKIINISSTHGKDIINLYKKGKHLVFDFIQYKTADSDEQLVSTIEVDLENTLLMAKNIYHIRLSWSTQEAVTMCFLYINGKLIGQENIFTYNTVMPKHLCIGEIEDLDGDKVVIEDLIYYNKIFEVNLGDLANKVFNNTYWDNLPSDFVKSDTMFLPSFDGKSNVLSDNEVLSKDVIYYGKIIENTLTLSLTNDSKISDQRIPDVFDRSGQKVFGNWSGLGTSTAKFALSQPIPDSSIVTDQDEIEKVQEDLNLIEGYTNYEYNEKLKDLILKCIKIEKPQLMTDTNYAVIISDAYERKMKIYDVTDKHSLVLLYDDLMADGIETIKGYTLDLAEEELDVLIANNSLVVFKTFAPVIIKPDVQYETLGNIEHVHYSETFSKIVQNSVTVLDESQVEDGTYLIYVKNLAENKVYVKNQNTKEEIYEGHITDEITIINGISILINDITDVVDYDGVIFNTVKGNICNGSVATSEEVSPLYNYDASLKDYISETLTIVDQDALTDDLYEVVITKLTPASMRITKNEKNSKTILYEGELKADITEIPGLTFDCRILPEYSYISDAIIIKTVAKTGTVEGHVTYEDIIKKDDNYSEVLNAFLSPNISTSDEYLLTDNSYNFKLLNSVGSQFEITNEKTGELLYQGTVGDLENITCIPGLNIKFNVLPPKCSKNDTVLIKTYAVKFENVKNEIDEAIPFIHFSRPLFDLVENSIKIENLSDIADCDYIIQLVDKANEIIEIRTLAGDVLYKDTIGHNLNCIPGLLFNILDVTDIDELGAVIVTTTQTVIGVDVIVQYDIMVSNGNAGYDIPNEILAAGLIQNNYNNISEISFNRTNAARRKILYLRPRLINGLYDEAYDFSNSYKVDKSKYENTAQSMQLYYNELANENHNGYVRRLTYNVTGKDITTYYIDQYLYGYEVIGVISAGNKVIKECKLVKNPTDPLKKCFEVTLDTVDRGEIIPFDLALGGISFDYDTNSKTLMSNIYKTYNIEFESTGDQNYEIPLNISKHGYGLIKSVFGLKTTNLQKFDNENNLIVSSYKNVAYVDDSLFIDSNFSGSDDKVLAEYTIDQESFERPVLKIHFKDYPKKGTMIKIPALIEYYPSSEVFSIWYKTTPYQGTMNTDKTELKRISDWKFFITTLSSSKNNDMLNLNNVINRLPGGLIYSYKIGGEGINLSNINTDVDDCYFAFLNDYVTNDIDSYNFITSPTISVNKTSKNFQDAKINLNTNVKIHFNNLNNAINKYIGGYCLVENDKKELMVLMIGDLMLKESTQNVLSPKYGDLFRIENSPTLNN